MAVPANVIITELMLVNKWQLGRYYTFNLSDMERAIHNHEFRESLCEMSIRNYYLRNNTVAVVQS